MSAELRIPNGFLVAFRGRGEPDWDYDARDTFEDAAELAKAYRADGYEAKVKRPSVQELRTEADKMRGAL